MAENLNVGEMITSCSGGYLGRCVDNDETEQAQGTDCVSIDKYCYNDNEANCDQYGGLYQWNQAMCGSTTAGAQGICPTGWHIPTDDEIKTLEMFLGMTQEEADASLWRGTDEGTKLKSGGTSGFNFLMTGYRHAVGGFHELGAGGQFWSSLEPSETSGSAWRRLLGSTLSGVHRAAFSKARGYSLRCLRN